jgi:BAG domain
MSFFWSPFSRSQPTVPEEPETVELIHGKLVHFLTFSPGTLATLPIRDLQSLARKKAQLPDDVEIKLLFQGKKLVDTETAGKYNIRDGSRILLIASKRFEKAPPASSANSSKTSSARPTPSSTPPPKPATPLPPLEKISAIRQGIKNTYGEQITAFIQQPPSTRKERVETKARLSELLLQQLLKFDDVVIDPDDFASREARLERKAAVKWVQGLMEQVDGVDVDVPE